MSKLDKKYDFNSVQQNKMEFWQTNNLFKAQIDSNKPPFVVVLPPPNVTGHLHIGHAYGFSLPDIIVRYKKLQGYDAFIIPGTDHAGIATQTKYEKILKQTQKTDRFELGREVFLDKLKQWKDEQANYIHKQWNALGLSLDYDHYLFTLDDCVVRGVKEVFIKLYNDNVIYRAKKLVNWDVELKTAISNIEVIHKEVEQKLYHIKYFSVDKQDYVVVATSRPETMFGDKNLVFNPNDKRYTHLFNKQFINPVNDDLLNVVLDEYVDIEFGTGVMKCTPAHDFNDYELAKKHNLEFINILNEDGTLNDVCGKYSGLDRIKARELIVEELEQKGLLQKITTHKAAVGFSERTDQIVEPYMSYQWFIKIYELVSQTIKMQDDESKRTEFYPNRFNKTLLTWLQKTEDWCISRQLWWGHQIPVWYHKTKDLVYCDVNPPKDIENWKQDEDVLDTWFSSGIWPIFTTKWNEDDKFFKRYFPTSLMVTGVDILFFWVSRMMNFSQYLLKQRPFNDVLIHGLIRDSQGRKMSKSLNNGIDPFDVIAKYGLDAMRLFFASSTTIGEDLNFSDEKLAANWNYLNKIWNIAKYIELLGESKGELEVENSSNYHLINQWILTKLSYLVSEMTKNMDKYNLVVASKDLYDFIWNVFASQYLEYTKIMLQDESIKNETIHVCKYVFNQLLILLQPFAPNISEELWLKLNNTTSSILNQSYPKINFSYDESIVEELNNLVLEIRKLRLENEISNKIELEFDYQKTDFVINNKPFINQMLKMVNSKIVNEINDNNKYTYTISFNTNLLRTTYKQTIDIDLEIVKIQEQIKFVDNEILRVEKLLNNPGYVSKAPESLIKKEKEKLQTFSKQKENLLAQLNELNKEKIND